MGISEKDLDKYVKARVNVLMYGERGVGKTSLFLDTMQRNNKRYLYFSGSTLDPYVDLVGVPVKVHNTLEFLRPDYIIKADPEVIFIDEFNRSHKKVRNAVMELIQFRTINGVPFSSKLESVWAACNPDSDTDDDYDTERLDPAQRDRFQIHIEVPYKPDTTWFTKTYGNNGKAACNFWHALPDKQKKLVSPRRLAYALDWFAQDGDLGDVLDKSVSHDQLRLQLQHADITDTMTRWAKNLDVVEAKKFFINPNNFATCQDRLLKHKDLGFFLPHIPRERLAQLYEAQKVVQDAVARSFNATGEHREFLRTYASTGSNAAVRRTAAALIETAARLAAAQPQTQGRATQHGDPEWFLAQLDKGRPKEAMYPDVIASWTKNYKGKPLSKADAKTWSRLLGKLTNSIWTKTLNGAWSDIRLIVEEILPQGDFSKLYPDFLALKNKYGL
jgi:MoxR-like ATPase